jgi:hypothetical protein
MLPGSKVCADPTKENKFASQDVAYGFLVCHFTVMNRVYFVPIAAALVTPQGLQLLQVPTPSRHPHESLRYLMFRLISTGCRPDIPWREEEYYPKLPRVGASHKMREKIDLAAHNYSDSILYRVPVALHSLIIDNLSGLDILNLSATCRKMRIEITSLVQLRRTPVARAAKYAFTSHTSLATRRWSKSSLLGHLSNRGPREYCVAFVSKHTTERLLVQPV